ncbi:uncharacterized protein G2W53_039239 [Senna tora]|uniref:Uncharacterized protein n=1 Tax=Senna tora TaxID=362788 RepID=A0A834W3C1_9FABA|nr:uncharacterized protein G2W53_039239 [Senna tora]
MFTIHHRRRVFEVEKLHPPSTIESSSSCKSSVEQARTTFVLGSFKATSFIQLGVCSNHGFDGARRSTVLRGRVRAPMAMVFDFGFFDLGIWCMPRGKKKKAIELSPPQIRKERRRRVIESPPSSPPRIFTPPSSPKGETTKIIETPEMAEEDTRVVKDYATPSAEGLQSSISRPTVQATQASINLASMGRSGGRAEEGVAPPAGVRSSMTYQDPFMRELFEREEQYHRAQMATIDRNHQHVMGELDNLRRQAVHHQESIEAIQQNLLALHRHREGTDAYPTCRPLPPPPGDLH